MSFLLWDFFFPHRSTAELNDRIIFDDSDWSLKSSLARSSIIYVNMFDLLKFPTRASDSFFEIARSGQRLQHGWAQPYCVVSSKKNLSRPKKRFVFAETWFFYRLQFLGCVRMFRKCINVSDERKAEAPRCRTSPKSRIHAMAIKLEVFLKPPPINCRSLRATKLEMSKRNEEPNGLKKICSWILICDTREY